MIIEIIATSAFGALVSSALWIYRVATNHLPHLQAGIDGVKEAQKEQITLLVSMDKSLAVIADRTKEL